MPVLLIMFNININNLLLFADSFFGFLLKCANQKSLRAAYFCPYIKDKGKRPSKNILCILHKPLRVGTPFAKLLARLTAPKAVYNSLRPVRIQYFIKTAVKHVSEI